MKESGTLTKKNQVERKVGKLGTVGLRGVDEEVGKGKRKERKQKGKLQIEGDRLQLVAES